MTIIFNASKQTLKNKTTWLCVHVQDLFFKWMNLLNVFSDKFWQKDQIPFSLSNVNSNDIVYNSGMVFASLRSQLCACMMSHSDNRAITVSHLIPSHSWMPWIFTEQPLIKNGNNQETSECLWHKNTVSSSCWVSWLFRISLRYF